MRCNAESFILYPKAYLCLVYILGPFDFNIFDWGNRNCTKGFLLIVCTVMLQTYYEGKIVELYIWEMLFVEKMHKKKANAETLCEIWFVAFVPWLPSSMSNHNDK